VRCLLATFLVKMFSLDFFILFVSFSQPLIVGLLAYIGLGRYVSKSSLSVWSDKSIKTSQVRVYECSTFTRLSPVTKYAIPMSNLLCAFIVYDVDLILFVSEVVSLLTYSVAELIILFFFIFCFFCGLVIDYRKTGTSWYIF